MRLKEAEEKMLNRMKMLSRTELRGLHARTLKALRIAVCSNTCDQLQGYHSDGCHQLTDEFYRREKEMKEGIVVVKGDRVTFDMERMRVGVKYFYKFHGMDHAVEKKKDGGLIIYEIDIQPIIRVTNGRR